MSLILLFYSSLFNLKKKRKKNVPDSFLKRIFFYFLSLPPLHTLYSSITTTRTKNSSSSNSTQFYGSVSFIHVTCYLFPSLPTSLLCLPLFVSPSFCLPHSLNLSSSFVVLYLPSFSLVYAHLHYSSPCSWPPCFPFF